MQQPRLAALKVSSPCGIRTDGQGCPAYAGAMDSRTSARADPGSAAVDSPGTEPEIVAVAENQDKGSQRLGCGGAYHLAVHRVA